MMLSVIVITYGHEKTISRCLDHILTQKVNFEMEVIVGEDKSPDSTRSILKEYEQNYPNIFKMIYRDKNIGGRLNLYDCQMQAKGHYIAFCEGDDYWIDENKLQKQVDFLLKNTDYIAVYHNIRMEDEYESPIIKKKYPVSPKKNFSLFLFDCGFLPSQMGSLVMKNLNLMLGDFSWLSNPLCSPGDRTMVLLLLSLGKIFVMPQIMSAYQYVTNGGFSFSASKKNENLARTEEKWTFLAESFEKNKLMEIKSYCEMKKSLVQYRQNKQPLVLIRNLIRTKKVFFYCSRVLYCYVDFFWRRYLKKVKWTYIAR